MDRFYRSMAISRHTEHDPRQQSLSKKTVEQEKNNKGYEDPFF